jgi:Serine/threonine protein kinase
MNNQLGSEITCSYSELLSPDSPTKQPQAANPYKDIKVIKKISDSSFSLFLVFSETLKKHFVMKAYPYDGENISRHFLRESRFLNFSHPNVISILHCQARKKGCCDGKPILMSYILMELAPYGDFCKLLMSKKLKKEEKFARTYFHQLISAIEYIHSKGVAHTDLKLDNLLVGSEFQLILCDFDSCYFEDDENFSGAGSADYRAPEVKKKCCKDPKAADIYSAGVILFALTCHSFPYSEDLSVSGFDLYDALRNDTEKYWETLGLIHDNFYVSEEFKELFLGMLKADPAERWKIPDIKNSRWYQGPVYSKEELAKIMKKRLGL